MSNLNSYTGNVEVIDGLTPANGQDFALMQAHHIQVDENGKRLDEKLDEMAENNGSGGSDITIIALGSNTSYTLSAEQLAALNANPASFAFSISDSNLSGRTVILRYHASSMAARTYVSVYAYENTVYAYQCLVSIGTGSCTIAQNSYPIGGTSTGGGKAIIDVTELPINDINEDVFYRLYTGTMYYNGYAQKIDVHVVDDTDNLSEGLPFADLMTRQFTNVYYDISDSTAKGYLTQALCDYAASLGITITVGFYPLANLMPLLETSFAGVITDLADMTEMSTYYLYLEYKLYSYKEKWEALEGIGWEGEGKGAEIFNDPTNVASGNMSHAEGGDTKAIGDHSHAEGYESEASGNHSHAEGSHTVASGNGSHAEGFNSVASGDESHAEGSAKAIGNNSHAEGYGEASGYNSHAENYGKAIGEHSHAEGMNCEAIGGYSHAEGIGSKAKKAASHAEGSETMADGDACHAEGYKSTASSFYSHAEGNETTASGAWSHAEGHGTIASSSGSHSEGWQTKAIGNYSHAEGVFTEANGQGTHAEGYKTKAAIAYAHAEGTGTIAGSANQHAQGKYNIEDTNGKYAHIVGNGTVETPSNAHTLDWEGNAWFAGTVKVGGTGYDDPNAIELGVGGGTGGSVKSITFTDRPTMYAWLTNNFGKLIKSTLTANLFTEPMNFTGCTSTSRTSFLFFLFGPWLDGNTVMQNTISYIEVSDQKITTYEGNVGESGGTSQEIPDDYWAMLEATFTISYIDETASGGSSGGGTTYIELEATDGLMTNASGILTDEQYATVTADPKNTAIDIYSESAHYILPCFAWDTGNQYIYKSFEATNTHLLTYGLIINSNKTWSYTPIAKQL